MSWALLPAVLVVAGCGEGQRPVARADPRNAAQVAQGQALYERYCASCHGAKLEGQPEWRKRKADGRLPAPPHDDSGHTWHHAEEQLLRIMKNGLKPPDAPEGYASDMPAFAGTLSDGELVAVLSFIESRWSARVIEARRERFRGGG